MVRSSLMTQDPYHLPGYLGYVPQFKFRIGGTYGSTTHNIMYSPEKTQAKLPFRIVDEVAFKGPLERSQPAQEEGWSNTKLKGIMVPGYTGYVPKGQHFFGERYTQACDHAIKSFEKDLVVKDRKEETLRMVPRKTLPKLGKGTAFPVKKRDFDYGTSPYRLPSDHSEKYFMSGYTGFVPRARDQLAQSYPELTHKAINIHDTEQGRIRGLTTRPLSQSLSRARTAPSRIYTESSGLIPNYTGHVPAMKFKFGRTYGMTTVDALNNTK